MKALKRLAYYASAVALGLAVSLVSADVREAASTFIPHSVTLNLAGTGLNVGRATLVSDITTVTGSAPGVLSQTLSGTQSQLALQEGSAGSNPTSLIALKSRATDGTADTIVASGDRVLDIRGYGASGTVYQPSMELQGVIDSTPGSGTDMPGRWDFLTSADGSATLTQRFSIKNDGSIIAGPSNSLDADVTGSIGQGTMFSAVDASNYIAMGFGAYLANTSGAAFRFYKTRSTSSTMDANTIVVNGDELGRLQFLGADGVQYRSAAAIIAKVSAVPGSGDMPGSLDFQLSPDGSATLASVLKLDQDKSATFTGSILDTATTNVGWSLVTGANTACNTTCTNACVFGQDTDAASKPIVDCADATADRCTCAGAS